MDKLIQMYKLTISSLMKTRKFFGRLQLSKKIQKEPVRIATIATVYFIVIALLLPLLFGTPLYSFAEYLASMFSAIAIGWLILNAFLQRKSIDIQQRDLQVQQEILGKTLSTLFSQFFVMQYSEFEKALNRICERICLISNIEFDDIDKTTNDCFIKLLANNLETVPSLTKNLLSDPGELLRREITLYLDTYKELQNIIKMSRADQSTKSAFNILIASNPASQLNNVFEKILYENSKIS